jgi:hypothetical protein
MSQVQNKSLNEGKTAEPPGPKRPLSLWRNRDYVSLWSGQMVSSIGTEVSRLAFPLLILAITLTGTGRNNSRPGWATLRPLYPTRRGTD